VVKETEEVHVITEKVDKMVIDEDEEPVIKTI